MSDSGKVISDVLAGRHDGQLLDIVESVGVRLKTGQVQTRWRIRHGDVEVTEETVTIGEMRTICDLLSAARGERVSWVAVDPKSEPGDFIAILATVLQTRGGMALNEAEQMVAALPMSDLTKHLDQYELSPAPKD